MEPIIYAEANASSVSWKYYALYETWRFIIEHKDR
jgi:hypothetical protein